MFFLQELYFEGSKNLHDLCLSGLMSFSEGSFPPSPKLAKINKKKINKISNNNLFGIHLHIK